MDEYKQDIEFIPGEPPHVAIFKNGLSMSDDEIEEEFHAFQNRIKELEEMLSVEVDNATNKRIKELEDRNKLLSRDNINLRKFIVDSRNKLSDFITRT